jgi:alanyl-tRNA synthetase
MGTLTDIQHCLRLNDWSEVGDGTHHLDFHMLGLFSFRQWTVSEGIEFWMSFLHSLGIPPDTVTVHPDRSEWREFYHSYGVRVEDDPGCTWSDGQISGYCTEFYRQGVEIGNIVNPLGTCLDCGFGGERLQHFLDGVPPPPTRGEVMGRTIEVLLDSGVQPGPRQQGYVLRSLIREHLRTGHPLPDHPVIATERQRRERLLQRMPQVLRRFPGRSPEYYWETHGIHPEDWES